MTKVRINYDGWLALPAAVRERLGLSTGDELELELTAGRTHDVRSLNRGGLTG
jgi:AbrB family looped-hinge helix DNA binding protein